MNNVPSREFLTAFLNGKGVPKEVIPDLLPRMAFAIKEVIQPQLDLAQATTEEIGRFTKLILPEAYMIAVMKLEADKAGAEVTNWQGVNWAKTAWMNEDEPYEEIQYRMHRKVHKPVINSCGVIFPNK